MSPWLTAFSRIIIDQLLTIWGPTGLSVIRLYNVETVPSLALDLISADIDPVTMTVIVTGSMGAVYDNIYPVIVGIQSSAGGLIYETQVNEIDKGAFRVVLPWTFGDELYISIIETTSNPMTIGPFYLGRVPLGYVVGGYPVSGYAQAVDVKGNIAVVGEKEGRLNVVDTTDPANPLFLGSLNFNEEIRQVRIIGERVYMASGYYMRIVDIGNPANPVQLSGTNLGSGSYGIDVFDGIAFAARPPGYIYVYDVRNEQNPVYKSYKYLGGGTVQDVKVDALTGRLYAVVDNGASSYLSVLDISNIANLIEIGKVTVPGNPRRFEIIGDKMYIAVKSGMVILSLNRLGTADFGRDGDGDGRADDILSYMTTTGGGTSDVDIKGNHAYIADGSFNNGVRMIDITDPNTPEEIAKIDVPGDAIELKIAGDYLYLAGGSTGLSVIRLY